MIEEESSERMFRIILLSNQKRISLQAVFLLTNLLYEESKDDGKPESRESAKPGTRCYGRRTREVTGVGGGI